MSHPQQDDWPPIISNANRPRWVVWRGVAITAFMWGLFFLIVAREMDLAWQGLSLVAGHPVEDIDAGLEEFLLRMRPTVVVILVLVAVLAVATLASRRQRNAALLRPQPTPVPDSELARDLGLSEQELNDIRRQNIVALDVDEQGRVSVRPDWKTSAGATGN